MQANFRERWVLFNQRISDRCFFEKIESALPRVDSIPQEKFCT